MGQTGSAQREPSMEEILASIRRIIEDSDQGAPPIEQPMAAAAEASPAKEVDAFRAELDDHDQPGVEAPLQPEMIDAPVARIHPLRPEQPMPQEPAPQPLDGYDDLLPEAEEPSHSMADEQSMASMDDDQADDVFEPVVDAPVEAKGSLISGATERQVAAAFGELSDAFAASRRRSFDEMAEEMLRPMLQDWLDNNLPGLVEKLVREEIERVARGGKA